MKDIHCEKCVCGHIQQNNGIAKVPCGGIHSVIVHYGKCKSKKCKTCNNDK